MLSLLLLRAEQVIEQEAEPGALSRKHKELTALAVAVSQNCFD
jgi:alkylhydroperoxidase/carboxymuconolactone decarboxylase family protein YurZ